MVYMYDEDNYTPHPDEVYKEGFTAGIWEAMSIVANEIEKLNKFIEICEEQNKSDDLKKAHQEKLTLESIQHFLEIRHG